MLSVCSPEWLVYIPVAHEGSTNYISPNQNFNKKYRKSSNYNFLGTFIYLFIYLFIFGCIGSSLMHAGFLFLFLFLVAARGATPH